MFGFAQSKDFIEQTTDLSVYFTSISKSRKQALDGETGEKQCSLVNNVRHSAYKVICTVYY